MSFFFIRSAFWRFSARTIEKLILLFQIKKGIYYSLVTTSEFELEDDDLNLENSIKPDGLPGSSSSPRLILPPTDVERCRSLMTGIVEYFTPVLFTPVRVPAIWFRGSSHRSDILTCGESPGNEILIKRPLRLHVSLALDAIAFVEHRSLEDFLYLWLDPLLCDHKPVR
jgi:hypothetical protein